MPVYELVLSSDTIDEGRIKINNGFSGTSGLWSGGTGEQSLIHNSGEGNIASGDYSIASGGNNIIDIDSSTSFIFSTGSTLSGVSRYSGIFAGSGGYIDSSVSAFIAGGVGNSISGSSLASIVGGIGNIINGNSSWASVFGGNNNSITIQSQFSSILGGSGNNINDFADASSIVGGIFNTIDGSDYSVTLGGRGNEIAAGSTHSLIAGGGAQSTSAFTMTFGGTNTSTPSSANNTIAFEFTDGSAYWDGSNNLGPADYAEYFEWNDGNNSNEDRVGYFVSLINDKIEIGNSNIIGIVSANPAIIGDSAPLKWNGIYLKDEWGRLLKKNYQIYSIVKIDKKLEQNKLELFIDNNNNVYSEPPSPSSLLGVLYNEDISDKIFIRNENIKIINPSFNPSESYIPRKDRKEWSPIGLLGKLHVRTSENITGTKIGVDSSGFAINGTDYHVLKEIKAYDGNYGIVQVLFR